MKSFRRTLSFTVPERMGFINITPQVQEAVEDSVVQEGLCLVNAMHITASVFINDDEPGLHADYKRWLEKLAPFDASPEVYHHNRTGEDNGSAAGLTHLEHWPWHRHHKAIRLGSAPPCNVEAFLASVARIGSGLHRHTVNVMSLSNAEPYVAVRDRMRRDSRWHRAVTKWLLGLTT